MTEQLSLWDTAGAGDGSPNQMSLGELLGKFELIDVINEEGVQPFAIVAPKSMAEHAASTAPTGEIGTTQPSPFTSFVRQEYNSELAGLQGLKNYDRMRKSDGTVRSTLRTIKTPVLAARWFMDPKRDLKTGEAKKVDQTAADHVWKNLSEGMSSGWTQVLTEALLMCDFGYYMFEKVWSEEVIDGKRRTVLKKLAPRHPMDVKEWIYDSNGGPAGAWFYSPTGLIQDEYFIPIDRLLVFSFDKEAGNIEGISLLRSAYKHWYYKEQLYKIDAIQKERHGIGIPVVKLPVGYKSSDVADAQNLGRNLRTNDRAHVVLPPLWDIMMLKLEGQLTDALKSIEHHNREIEKNILAAFIEGDAKEEDQIMFLKATRFIADIVCEVFNLYVIPQMVDFNFMRAGYPRLKARRIGEQADWRTISFAIRNFIGAGVLTPDDRLERHIRDEMDLPLADPESARKQQQPQNPGAPGKPGAPEAGPPRQGPPSAKPPAGNAGRDASGGK